MARTHFPAQYMYITGFPRVYLAYTYVNICINMLRKGSGSSPRDLLQAANQWPLSRPIGHALVKIYEN